MFIIGGNTRRTVAEISNTPKAGCCVDVVVEVNKAAEVNKTSVRGSLVRL
jgi:hypothetical protein